MWLTRSHLFVVVLPVQVPYKKLLCLMRLAVATLMPLEHLPLPVRLSHAHNEVNPPGELPPCLSCLHVSDAHVYRKV